MCALSRNRSGLQTFNGTEDEWIVRIANGCGASGCQPITASITKNPMT